MLKPAPQRNLRDVFKSAFDERAGEFTPQFRDWFDRAVWPRLARGPMGETELTEDEYHEGLLQMRKEMPGFIGRVRKAFLGGQGAGPVETGRRDLRAA